MTDDLVNRLSVLGIGAAPDFPPSEVLVRWELVVEAIRRIEEQNAEIERLRAERDRWRRIADDFYEAGSNLASHSEVAEDYEEARRD